MCTREGSNALPLFCVSVPLTQSQPFPIMSAIISEVATVADGEQDIRQLQERLNMLDRRLDDIDSMVSAVAERVMSQPVIMNVTCPRCGREIEISIIGTHKPAK